MPQELNLNTKRNWSKLDTTSNLIAYYVILKKNTHDYTLTKQNQQLRSGKHKIIRKERGVYALGAAHGTDVTRWLNRDLNNIY